MTGADRIVSRGGRPDLAGPMLRAVGAATLLIVGGADTVVIGMNEDAYHRLRCEPNLRIIPVATHLFEEPGALERVAALAARLVSTLARARRSAQRGRASHTS